jgi:hypothetical protein
MTKRGQRGGGGTPLVAAAIVVLLPVLYFLSSGPAYRLGEAGYMSGDAMRAIYWPLIQLGHAWPAFNETWKFYLILWAG